MPIKKPTIFQVKNVEVIYKAEFSPPLLEVALPETQARLLKDFCNKFGLRFREIVFNNQAISSNLIYFRHPFRFGHFDTFIGVDELQTIFVNPETETLAWELTTEIMDIISKISKMIFKKQTLTFNIHCSSEHIKYSEFMNNINTFNFTHKITYSKGATFTIRSPLPGYLINIIFDQSLLIENGLFILMQVFLDESVQKYDDLFKNTISFLKRTIEPSFNMQINYEGRK
ncbi:MAG: hypothetical protein AB1491_10875 [Thermodesulfobacteriota bacterium]